MTEKPVIPRPKYGENLLSAISAGVFFVLLGAIFLATPNLSDDIIKFFTNFDIIRVPNASVDVYLPAPKTPWAHTAVYTAAAQFTLIWGFFLIFMLALRFAAGSPLRKKAENVSDAVYNFGAFYLITAVLIPSTRIETWFVFWTLIIMLIGVTLIIRAIILALQS